MIASVRERYPELSVRHEDRYRILPSTHLAIIKNPRRSPSDIAVSRQHSNIALEYSSSQNVVLIEVLNEGTA
ncbi:hypothetical protein [Mycobacteroides chelonae]|uniref:hypothetical protein n=1 Tax=Mycobacteroides chelonae TaxID=1774 RepID=UPI001FEDCBEC|nr:hypothetical protein [Mycobacteroides chelonae]